MTSCYRARTRLKDKNKKTSEKVWKIKIKVLIFVVRFASVAVIPISCPVHLSLSQREPEKQTRKKKRKKTLKKVWQLKINRLPLHPLLKRSAKFFEILINNTSSTSKKIEPSILIYRYLNRVNELYGILNRARIIPNG